MGTASEFLSLAKAAAHWAVGMHRQVFSRLDKKEIAISIQSLPALNNSGSLLNILLERLLVLLGGSAQLEQCTTRQVIAELLQQFIRLGLNVGLKGNFGPVRGSNFLERDGDRLIPLVQDAHH